MLAGLSPNQLSMANTMLASAVAGAMGIVAAPLAQADSTTLVLFIVPALAAALFAGFTSLVDRLRRRLRHRDRPVADVVRRRRCRGSRPTAATRCPASQALLTFVLLVVALSLRGASLPSRGELVEKRLPSAPRPQRLARPARGAGDRRCRAADRAAVRLPAGADAVADRHGRVPVAGGDHRVRRPGLARPGHARRRRPGSPSRTWSSRPASASRGARSSARSRLWWSG